MSAESLTAVLNGIAHEVDEPVVESFVERSQPPASLLASDDLYVGHILLRVVLDSELIHDRSEARILVLHRRVGESLESERDRGLRAFLVVRDRRRLR